MRWILIAAIGFAAGSGFFIATALGIGSQAPTKTTTVNVGTGEQGPAGPPGPAGADGKPGAEGCPTGSSFQAIQINHATGHVVIWTCVAG